MLVVRCARPLRRERLGRRDDLRATASSPAVAVSFAPADGSRSVRPDTPVVVTVANGTVKTAQLSTSDGHRLQGRVDGSGGWQATTP